MKRFDFLPKIYLIIIFIVLAFFSCKKLVNINPPINQLTNTNVFTSDNSADAVMAGIYSEFINTSTYDDLPTLLPALSSDELNNYSTNLDYTLFSNDAIPVTEVYTNSFWSYTYNVIYQANAVIENLKQNSAVSVATQNQLTGEAKFMRAFFYFELVNFYGDIPLLTSTNVKTNASAVRTPELQVYQQIITDLQDAGNLLTDTYAGANRARANKEAVNALLARVYLYYGNLTGNASNYVNAETLATGVISNPLYSLETNLNNVFLTNSNETIFQYATENGYTNVGQIFLPGTSNAVNFAYTNDFINAIEPGDLRESNWINKIVVGTTSYYYPYKYKQYATTSVNQEYLVTLRLAEQYLIRAEARADQNNLSGALADLNVIRNRAGLPNSTATTQAAVLAAIQHERRIELASEWGHRWFDLKRTNTANAILGSLKLSWKATSQLYPIPASQIIANPNLTQNPGY